MPSRERLASNRSPARGAGRDRRDLYDQRPASARRGQPGGGARTPSRQARSPSRSEPSGQNGSPERDRPGGSAEFHRGQPGYDSSESDGGIQSLRAEVHELRQAHTQELDELKTRIVVLEQVVHGDDFAGGFEEESRSRAAGPGVLSVCCGSRPGARRRTASAAASGSRRV